MKDQIPKDIKSDRFRRLTELQNEISLEKNKAMLGEILEVLVDGESKTDKTMLSSRTSGGKIVNFKGDKELIGKFVKSR